MTEKEAIDISKGHAGIVRIHSTMPGQESARIVAEAMSIVNNLAEECIRRRAVEDMVKMSGGNPTIRKVDDKEEGSE